jgi:hypothetical protein
VLLLVLVLLLVVVLVLEPSVRHKRPPKVD